MRTEGLNLTQINQTVLDIFIEPANKRHLVVPFNLSLLNLTWNVIDFYDLEMNIQLNFSQPLMISPLKL